MRSLNSDFSREQSRQITVAPDLPFVILPPLSENRAALLRGIRKVNGLKLPSLV
jgi:hypothetical protein